MRTITATEARKNLYKLIDKTSNENVPIQITSKRNNVIIISEDDWRSIQETLHLLSIPGMRESIIEGMNEPLDKLTDNLEW